MATTASLAPLFRQSVGFDRFNDFFESALHSEINASGPLTMSNDTAPIITES